MQNLLDKSAAFDVHLNGVYLQVFTGPWPYELLKGYHGGLISYTFYSMCLYDSRWANKGSSCSYIGMSNRNLKESTI